MSLCRCSPRIVANCWISVEVSLLCTSPRASRDRDFTSPQTFILHVTSHATMTSFKSIHGMQYRGLSRRFPRDVTTHRIVLGDFLLDTTVGVHNTLLRAAFDRALSGREMVVRSAHSMFLSLSWCSALLRLLYCRLFMSRKCVSKFVCAKFRQSSATPRRGCQCKPREDRFHADIHQTVH